MTTKLAKWASEHDQIIKSKLSYGHQANPLHQKRGWPTIGSDLMVIWEMSVKQNQQREMESHRVDGDSRNFNQSVSATNDRYMVDALSKVRESDVTHPESLTRMNGSWMHNRSFKK
jgi:hypothetical protein